VWPAGRNGKTATLGRRAHVQTPPHVGLFLHIYHHQLCESHRRYAAGCRTGLTRVVSRLFARCLSAGALAKACPATPPLRRVDVAVLDCQYLKLIDWTM